MFCPFFARLEAMRGRRAGATAAVFGAISAAALPPVFAIPVLGLSIPALLALVGGQARMRDAFWIACCFAFAHDLCGIYWITEPILLEAAQFWWLVPFAAPLLAAAMAPYIAIPCALCWRAKPGLPRALVFSGAYVLSDLVRQFAFTGFPWNLLGSVWAVPGAIGDVMLQPAALVGAHGLTLFTVLIATTPTIGRRAILSALAALVAWAGFGLWRLRQPTAPAPGLTVLMVQGDVALGQKYDLGVARDIFGRYLRLTSEGIADIHGPAVVIWPETASLFDLVRDDDARAAIARASGGAPVLAGSVRFDQQDRPRNSLIAVTGPGPAAAIYDKTHLVPFGEYQPTWIPIQILPGSGFASGDGPETFHVPGLPPYGALICYEAIFPAAIVDEAHRPDWLVNVTNDTWFGDTSGPRQHLATVRMRAVEEGLPLMRAANSGITAGFDAFGHELGRLGLNRQGMLALSLPGKLPPTPFSRGGLCIPLAMALCVAGLGALMSRWRRGGRTNQ
jgi:apolipoprotein N-acyltransferase